MIGGQWHGAVRDLTLSVRKNETLALVGESGSGKSITALSILGLLPEKVARIGAGQLLFGGRDLTRLSRDQLRDVRGGEIAMVFQEPMTSLNPTMRVGEQIGEMIRAHRPLSAKETREEAVKLLLQVGIPSAERRVDDYPHQFSGGMRQRVMIAIAIACRPTLLLADEPTTALDVTIQAQVLGVLDKLKREQGMSMLFITHNLGVVALIADRVAVMYAGQVVELASVTELFAKPTHPYTEALLKAMPRVDRDSDDLAPIPGAVPSLINMPIGCAFANRCPLKEPRCEQESPLLAPLPTNGDHGVRCFVRNPEAL
ncbi:ABC transporter ATP-binding protein [Pseudomonas sp. RIT-PI-AD]|uniref:ABC transporter ATP-binding protein n=1 Tax=Pseudomonas sp. RIT-PI-AD TaxID=3035294 RepID=UPI0021DA89D5|nr:ABC transporter ATP-binding protein [Pseudomonas sp. RIT-PI-AD]